MPNALPHRPRSVSAGELHLRVGCIKGRVMLNQRKQNSDGGNPGLKDLRLANLNKPDIGRRGQLLDPGWASRKTSWLPHPQQDVFSAPCESRVSLRGHVAVVLVKPRLSDCGYQVLEVRPR